MIRNPKFIDLLVEACKNDEAVTDNIDMGNAIADTEDILEELPEVEESAASKLKYPVTVENVRIMECDGNFYMESVELFRLMESMNMNVTTAVNSILEKYELDGVSKDNFIITIPDNGFEKTLKKAECGDTSAIENLKEGANILRSLVSSGYPIKKLHIDEV